MEEELIDTTTEEGKKKLEEMEREQKAEKASAAGTSADVVEVYSDPE